MISPANKPHQKHAKLALANMGEWGRNELAILGTDCNSIRQLAHAVIEYLPQYNIAYIDADHKSANAEQQNVSAINTGAYIEYTNKISFTRLDINTQPNTFQKRTLLNDCDLILVNGNHFTAAKQIIVVDEKKSLEKKLDKLTSVQLILLKDGASEIPAYLSNHLPDIASVPTCPFTDSESIFAHIQQTLQHQIPLVNGLVLAGGKSTRMGSDKSGISYHGISQREHVFHLLSSFCNEVFISCNAEQVQTINHLPIVQDSFLGLGPLGGILSAFQQNPNAAWLAVACDLPFLTTETIQALIEHRNISKMATAFLDNEGKLPEPLVTIWEPKAYPVLLQFLAQGYSCPRKILINSDVKLIQAPNTFAFKNINTTEEYKETINILHNKHSS